VYRVDDLRCVHLFTSRWPVNAFAFHPSLPLLAVGTGSYDGGYAYEGQLLILDLRTGHRVSVLEHPLMVEALAWSDPSTLAVVFAPLTDEDEDGAPPRSIQATLVRDDWDTARPRMISWSGLALGDASPSAPLCAARPGAGLLHGPGDLCQPLGPVGPAPVGVGARATARRAGRLGWAPPWSAGSRMPLPRRGRCRPSRVAAARSP
jgi:hypothetical protein